MKIRKECLFCECLMTERDEDNRWAACSKGYSVNENSKSCKEKKMTYEEKYKEALEDVKKEVEKKLSMLESKDTAGDSYAIGVYDAYNEFMEFIKKQEV